MAQRGRPKKCPDVECICRKCEKKFSLPEWAVVKMGRGKYCTRACYESSTGPHRNHFVPPETKHCGLCEKEFLVGGFGRPKRRQQFCSMSCATNAKYKWGILKGGSKKGHHLGSMFDHLRPLKSPTI